MNFMNRNLSLRIVSTLLSMILICTVVIPVSATDTVNSLTESTNQLQNQLASLNQELNQLSNEISAISAQASSLASEITAVKSELAIAKGQEASQYEAMKAVNQTLISLYWGIGQEIYNQQNEKGWGKSIVEVLANEIKKIFQMFKDFLLVIYGECEIFMLHIVMLKISHH